MGVPNKAYACSIKAAFEAKFSIFFVCIKPPCFTPLSSCIKLYTRRSIENLHFEQSNKQIAAFHRCYSPCVSAYRKGLLNKRSNVRLLIKVKKNPVCNKASNIKQLSCNSCVSTRVRGDKLNYEISYFYIKSTLIHMIPAQLIGEQYLSSEYSDIRLYFQHRYTAITVL